MLLKVKINDVIIKYFLLNIDKFYYLLLIIYKEF